jgi:Fic family protein
MNPKDFQSPEAGKTILMPTGYHAFIPHPLPPHFNWSSSLVSTLAQAERDLSRMATLIGSFAFPRLLIQSFIRNEAVISSRIEGTQATLADLYTYETTQLALFEQTGDVREVFNYVRVMDYGLERLNTLPISLRLIRELHGKLLENVRGTMLTPGEFRRSQNWIGPPGDTLDNAPYVPPPVEEMHKALDSLERFIHTDTQISPLVRAGMIHYQFEAIHPFLDGNGRVGRLLTVLLLCEWGLLPQPLLNLSIYIERYRQEYYDHLLAVSQRGAWEAWLSFFLRGISEQAREDVWRMDRLQNLRVKYQALVEADRNPQRMASVVDFLFSRPILSVRQAVDGLAIPFKTATDYLAKLERSGVLREITGHARNRIFEADEIMRAIQGIDGG